MAEFDELDELLSGSLKRAAQPGDSAGVADTIRARVAAGDVGTPAPNGSAPGFGGSLGWIPWVGAIVVLGLVGGTLGATGAFGRPDAAAPVSDSVLTSLDGDSGVGAAACPTGAPITELQPGQHVVALARTQDSADIEVRDPAALDETVWVTAKALKSLGDNFSTLPVSGCGVLTSTPIPAPVVAPVTPVAPPSKPSKPGVPADTTAPVVGAITVDATDNCKPVITAQISDNVGVSGATLTGTSGSPWNFNQTVVMTHVGGATWKGTLTMPSGFLGIVNLSITAHDAAGNAASGGSKFTDTPGCPIG
jgi:hypothetical protein